MDCQEGLEFLDVFAIAELRWILCGFLSNRAKASLVRTCKTMRSLFEESLYRTVYINVNEARHLDADTYMSIYEVILRSAHVTHSFTLTDRPDNVKMPDIEIWSDGETIFRRLGPGLLSRMPSLISFRELLRDSELPKSSMCDLARLAHLERLQISSQNTAYFLSLSSHRNNFPSLASLRITHLTTLDSFSDRFELARITSLDLSFSDEARDGLGQRLFSSFPCLESLSLERAYLSPAFADEPVVGHAPPFSKLRRLALIKCDNIGWLGSASLCIKRLDAMFMPTYNVVQLLANAGAQLCEARLFLREIDEIPDELIAALRPHGKTLEKLIMDGCAYTSFMTRVISFEGHLRHDLWRRLAGDLQNLKELAVRPKRSFPCLCQDEDGYISILDIGWPLLPQLRSLRLLGSKASRYDIERFLQCVFTSFLVATADDVTLHSQPPLECFWIGDRRYKVTFKGGRELGGRINKRRITLIDSEESKPWPPRM